MLNPDDILIIKKICASRVLDALGQPYRRCSRGFTLRSPMRKDTKASISYIVTSRGIWHWTDFGTGQRGSHIDFVMKVLQISYVAALYYLQTLFQTSYLQAKQISMNNFYFSTPQKDQKQEIWEIDSVTELEDSDKNRLKHFRHIFTYVPSVIKKIRFRHKEKRFSKECLCCSTISGGYEVFTAEPSLVRGSFKTVIGKKDISVCIKNHKVIVAESMIDAISTNILIGSKEVSLVSLNTVHNKEIFIEYMLRNKSKFKYVLLALDNDHMGFQTREIMIPKLLKLGFDIYVLRYKYKDPNLQLIHNPNSYSCEHIL